MKIRIIIISAIVLIAAAPGLPVVRDDEGNFVSLGDNGVVDSKGNLNVFRIEENGIHYRKYGKSCEVLIEDKIIERIPENENSRRWS